MNITKKTILTKGFTLIELLVVIAVLGILAAGVFTAINPLKRISQGNDSRIKSDISQIAQAAQAYFTTNQSYPKDVAQLVASGDLKVEPKVPGTSVSYTIAVTPDGCTGVNSSACTDTAIFAPLNDPQTAKNVWCFRSSTNSSSELPAPTCQLNLGQPVDTFSIGSPVLNGSFETPGGEYGLALNWTAPDNPNQSPGNKHATGSLLQSDNNGAILPKDGSFMQKVIAPTYTGIAQTISGLKPNTTYKLTAWIYPVRQGSGCPNVPDIGVGMTVFTTTLYTSCSQMDQWVLMTDQGKPDAQGKVNISFGNWTVPTFYVDAVRLEEVK